MTESLHNIHLQGRRLALAHLIEGIIAVFLLVVFVMVAPDRYTQLNTISPTADTIVGQLLPEDARLMQQSGLPVRIYAAYFTISELLVAVAATFMALLIAWIRPNDRAALLVSLILVSTAMTIASLGMYKPHWQSLVVVSRIVWSTSLIPFFYLFPDGRFVPPAARWLAAAWLIYTVSWLIFPQLTLPFSFGRGLTVADLPRIAWILVWVLSGVIAQVYRYLRVSNAVQRQQTRWAVLGFVTLLLTFITGIFILTLGTYVQPGPLTVAARLAGPSLILLGPVVLLLSIGISVLRYRLWDIDILIRLTIVYSLLTAILALAYFGSVLFSQQLFRAITGQVGQSPFAIVLSTLAIVALFNPLRKRIQTGIDRRFYRQQYDQAKVLATLSTTLREEVDLDRLTDSILKVVEETMQPGHLSMWFRQPPGKGRT